MVYGIGKTENVFLAQKDGHSMNKISVYLFQTNVIQVKPDFALLATKDMILKTGNASILCLMMLNQLIWVAAHGLGTSKSA